jgi:CopG family transcriptional regulator, nickel-responsive regulator
VLRLTIARVTMEKITRFGVSIEPNLLEKFDRMMKKKGYTNRSEAIRDLIRANIVQEKNTYTNQKGLGTLTILYDHHSGPLTERLLELQHEHYTQILTSTHIHVDHDNCLEVLILQGKIGDIQTLADNIKALKGIKHGELVLTSKSL